MKNVPAKTVFYSIEKTIKQYRKFSQRNFSQVVEGITVDQKLILQYIEANPGLKQSEIAAMVFKDNASLTRMIELMVQKGFLQRSPNAEDRRTNNIEITPKGKEVLEKLGPVITKNRAQAFAGVTPEELDQLERTLQKILANLE